MTSRGAIASRADTQVARGLLRERVFSMSMNERSHKLDFLGDAMRWKRTNSRVERYEATLSDARANADRFFANEYYSPPPKFLGSRQNVGLEHDRAAFRLELARLQEDLKARDLLVHQQANAQEIQVQALKRSLQLMRDQNDALQLRLDDGAENAALRERLAKLEVAGLEREAFQHELKVAKLAQASTLEALDSARLVARKAESRAAEAERRIVELEANEHTALTLAALETEKLRAEIQDAQRELGSLRAAAVASDEATAANEAELTRARTAAKMAEARAVAAGTELEAVRQREDTAVRLAVVAQSEAETRAAAAEDAAAAARAEVASCKAAAAAASGGGGDDGERRVREGQVEEGARFAAAVEKARAEGAASMAKAAEDAKTANAALREELRAAKACAESAVKMRKRWKRELVTVEMQIADARKIAEADRVAIAVHAKAHVHSHQSAKTQQHGRAVDDPGTNSENEGAGHNDSALDAEVKVLNERLMEMHELYDAGRREIERMVAEASAADKAAEAERKCAEQCHS